MHRGRWRVRPDAPQGPVRVVESLVRGGQRDPGSEKTFSENLRDKGFIRKLNRVNQSCFRNLVVSQNEDAKG